MRDRVKHGFRIGDRVADRREDFARRPLLVKRFLGLVEQADIFERDGRLIAKGLQQRELPLIERPYFLSPQQNRAKGLPLAVQGYDNDRAVPGALRDLHAKWIVGPRREHVIHPDGPAFEERAAGDRIAADWKRIDTAYGIRGGSFRCEMS